MANYLQLTSYRDLAYGPQVTKTAVALPANTTSALFTVGTGNVLVTSMYGICQTVCSTAATTLGLGITPTTGSTATTGIATATAITSKEVGTFVAPQPSSGVAGALVVGTDAGHAVYSTTPFVVPPGTITQTTNNTNTGKFSWYLTYVPLDPGANVT